MTGMSVEEMVTVRRVYQAVDQSRTDSGAGITAGQIAQTTGIALCEVNECLEWLAARYLLRLQRAATPELTQAQPNPRPQVNA